MLGSLASADLSASKSMSSTSQRHNSCDLLSSGVNSSQLPPKTQATDVNEAQDLCAHMLSDSGVPHLLSNTPTTRICEHGARRGFLRKRNLRRPLRPVMMHVDTHFLSSTTLCSFRPLLHSSVAATGGKPRHTGPHTPAFRQIFVSTQKTSLGRNECVLSGVRARQSIKLYRD